jgi:putative transposase
MARWHLLRAAHAHQFALHAYCFMPDHVHVLACGATLNSSLRPFVASWKQSTGYCFAGERTGSRLWQPGYFERVLREDEPDEIVARYIVENPIRGGLAAFIGDYPYVWSRWPID